MDLNDLYYFAKVVEHQGFSAAARALGVPKSKISRRIAELEKRLNTQLLYRSTRKLHITEIGKTYYQHCKAMLIEAESAQELIEQNHSEPRGLIRMTCPIALLHAHIGDMLAEFLVKHPQVTVHMEASNRRVDVVAEGVDLAIRVRPLPLDSSDLVLKVLSDRGLCLVASPCLINKKGLPTNPNDLIDWPSLGLGQTQGQVQTSFEWCLTHASGERIVIPHSPRLVTTDMVALRASAMAGVGVVQLPNLMVPKQVASGELVKLLPDWSPRREIIHVVFPSRRGMLPAVRALIDFLCEKYDSFDEE
ncbi:MAG: LysR family transcriptional regulator [Limnobacter sp.]|jgi:DNA-binding transcriptional LysR family regulator|uniref:LysR family transcriptional regulator n=1 Tax=Limnobacter profundi TaxID=2732163 RepID=A0ABX6N3G0_9BURK|nr:MULTISPECIES: LysR family transcriptional regulator [unclassified Limnobacter]MAG81973.1 LysR family transcriptional regulator [Sutterellaceae bacterium]MBA4315927.1 LysR family transcriptional regulator [Alcaligenaceae bacterium]MBT84080.1 LysR family transcriptional regulator [Sutterellaceae bacterium]MDP3271598.1 LysR family transcriptional regulator [Limnobacter sp.]MDZ4051075.1 LysR family transcriptional regulator [Limnobacter sp.]|tara:strand:- start:5034 stop:5948 length:915 start_codon:yes stop_codon:yes gene_type:complete